MARGAGLRLGCALAALLGLAPWGRPAAAIEAFDGRLQVHGFGEIQTRTIAQDYAQDFNLVQWYNVLSVKIEGDILPDGWGPFDLLSSYVRIEARYDCVYTHGCGTMPGVATFGNNANKMPRRLADARDQDYGGQIDTNQETVPPGRPRRNVDDRVTGFASFETNTRPLCAPGEPPGKAPGYCFDPNAPQTVANTPTNLEVRARKGFPGFDTFAGLKGADGVLGPNPYQGYQTGPDAADVVTNPNDDPFEYVFEPVRDFKWNFRDKRGPLGSTGRTLTMGPWLPKNYIRDIATLSDRGNPFRAARTPTDNGLVAVGVQSGPRRNDPNSYRWTVLDDQERGQFPSAIAPPTNPIYGFDPVDPLIASDSNGDGILDSGQAFSTTNAGLNYPNSRYVPSLVTNNSSGVFPNLRPFGGDFTNIIPCATPDTDPASNAQTQIANGNTAGCWTNVYQGTPPQPGIPDGRNIANVGGRGELPMRPAPDISNLRQASQNAGARGLYYPSQGLRQALSHAGGSFDDDYFNFSQANRAWNRGYSQNTTQEFKEGYLDMEFLDSRLWIRAGKQNIVWGKTELFRTTDQFNPQDLALASLPSLEESRIALFALRGVYSFYDVGPLQDLRLELAVNFDHVTAADLGACGEAFTPDVVCGLTTGYAAHGLTGVGIAGTQRPPDPWNSPKGLEYGGRVEFRWDRFSFAITDFYGYNDTPSPNPLSYYERNVDTVSGRPLVAEGLRGPVNTGRCRHGVPVFVRAASLSYPNGLNAPPQTNGFIVEDGDPTVTEPGRVPYWNSLAPMMGGLGVGTDPDCLKPGGATGHPNANLLNDITPVDLNGDTIPDPIYNAPPGGLDKNGDGDYNDPGDIPPLYSPQNALQYQSANQQLFSFVCLGTVTIGASVDGSACAWTVFASPNPLIGAPQANTTLAETFSAVFAGEPHQGIAGNGGLIQIIVQNQKGAAAVPSPIRPANRDARDGVMTSTGGIFRNGAVAYDPDSTQSLLSLDSVLTAEQRALFGCGPLYGTRCDSATRDRSNAVGVPSVGFAEGGGIDFLNTEASALTQSWPGIPGTTDGWTTTSRTLTQTSPDPLIQPGTIGFPNDSYCTRYDPKSPLANDIGLTRLPGCRGVRQVLTQNLSGLAAGAPIAFLFEQGYTPLVDGCVLGVSDPSNPASRGVAINGHPVVARRIRPKDDAGYNPKDPIGSAEDITQLLNTTCGAVGNTAEASNTRIGVADYAGASQYRPFAQTTWHPLAGCKTYAESRSPDPDVRRCDFTNRNFESEFMNGTSQIFRDETAVISWNFLQFLVMASCDSIRGGDNLSDPDCFDPRTAVQVRDPKTGELVTVPQQDQTWLANKCSFAAPQYCRNVKGFLNVAGVERNDVRAGGSKRFGRLDFAWHSGGELTLDYARRNVFGLSTDFAEDHTKTSWGMEFTWFSATPYVNADNFNNISNSQALNLTVSVDRPTFINFLNANRTFFINTQWFFNYITNYQSGGYATNGPFNVLFTVAVFTGYFQDRLNPNWVFVYDFNSHSGGLLPSLGYRFTENFSLTVGLNYFFGKPQLRSMPVRAFSPTTVRAGPNAYQDGVENALTQIRNRDEAYFRLRYTF